jgi:hypothetical protein
MTFTFVIILFDLQYWGYQRKKRTKCQWATPTSWSAISAFADTNTFF